MAGLSIANNLLANNALYNLGRNQQSLQNMVTQLSSGLRINSAADDPSGLAISTNLQTQVDGFQQASQNIQTANNAAQVAEGALQTTTDILQRIRDLAVEAASDVNSQADRNNLQAEVSQLLLEINRVSQGTNFNGQPLLDGSHAGFQPEQEAFFDVTANSVLATNGNTAIVNGVNMGNLIASATPVSSGGTNFFQTTPNVATPGIQGLSGNATVDGTLKLEVINTGASIAVRETFFVSATGKSYTAGSLFGPSAATTTFRNITANRTSSAAGFDNVAITLGKITAADVGATAYIKISQHVAASTNTSTAALTIQSGADEGDTVQIGLQATNAQTLRVSAINLALTSSTDPSLGAEDAIGQATNALNTVLSQRAQLGAVIVRLNEDANSDGIAAVNLQASESAIRDLNVGEATTEFTRLQVLVQVGTSVLSQSNVNQQTALALFR